MKEITLEKVDQIRERANLSYEEAKRILVEADGDVLEALINLEKEGVKGINNTIDEEDILSKTAYNVDDFKCWLKEIIEKGNVSRIKIKKEETVIADLPVNAGISAMVIAIVLPAVLAFGVIAAVATKVTIEITKCDGSVEVVNKYVKKVTNEVALKASIVASTVKEKASKKAVDVKEKLNDVKNDMRNKSDNKSKVYTGDDAVYTYTVKFDDEE
ncbi:MAG: DUF4342 domain-containing protein [Clostridium sp.]|uniref:DUF4342 domain-containing protein n=1 Tax=Clostridium sp. TaxID=1506 RepID=UPI003EE657D4